VGSNIANSQCDERIDMKVHIGPYVNWVGPYQIADKLFFWVDKYPDDELENRWDYKLHDKFGTWLASTWVADFCQWIHDFKKRTVKVKIDYYDVWSMDSTLTPIILPMLKKLKEVKQGSGYIELEDVPESMRLTSTEEWDAQQTFDFYHEPNLQNIHCDIHTRWEWVLDEMIWSFEQLCNDDYDAQFHTGVHDMKSVPCEWDENGKPTLYTFESGPNHTAEFDREGYEKYNERINNGTRLFGKYYRNLWD
jgi:hypothetical protein